MKIISDIGIQIPQVYLPKPGTDLKKWAVIACDQFTSQPEYWNEVEKIVGDAPSTLKLTFPEVYLEKPGGEKRIESIQDNMRKYMDEGVRQPRAHLHPAADADQMRGRAAEGDVPVVRLLAWPRSPEGHRCRVPRPPSDACGQCHRGVRRRG